jgi:hypothetical protein
LLPLLSPARGRAAAAAAEEAPPRRELAVGGGTGGLAAALAEARPGDHLLLEDGDYPGEVVVGASGAPGAPVVLRPRRRWGARFTGRVAVAGADVTLHGLLLDGAAVELAGDRARMTRCRQAGTEGIAVLVSGGRGVEVDRNELSGMRGRGISVRPDPRDPAAAAGAWIHRNHLRDFEGRRRENVHEGLQLGQSRRDTDASLRALVELNLLERVSVDSEAVSVKSSDNTVRLNTLLDCRAFVTNRHGERNRIVANRLERSLGITVHDRGNAVLGNVLVDCRDGIRVMAGNVAPDGWPGEGTHPAAADTLVAGNVTDRLTVGYAFRGHAVPATGTRVAAGQGGEGLRLLVEAGTVTGAEAPAAEGAPPPRLTPADVGPDAP